MASAIRKRVQRRASNRCEYCQISQQDLADFPFHVDHIIPKKHGGTSAFSNLCWSCHLCNLLRSTNLSGIDAVTGKIARLFHPRRQKWQAHFEWRGARLQGLTACGRATIAVLGINLAHRVRMRRFLIVAGVFPP
jgi:hypothetical protein